MKQLTDIIQKHGRTPAIKPADGKIAELHINSNFNFNYTVLESKECIIPVSEGKATATYAQGTINNSEETKKPSEHIRTAAVILKIEDKNSTVHILGYNDELRGIVDDKNGHRAVEIRNKATLHDMYKKLADLVITHGRHIEDKIRQEQEKEKAAENAKIQATLDYAAKMFEKLKYLPN
ncbi:hypothetical protein KY319_03170 [Candidatus Woesearchaeota archaeon]|nr:hypothetical protein [Candidatus Woesearchaeota archaeon]MBW3022268.1 hypothetical protein [Candidatus Woesearchaeota archaeon]